METTPIRPAPIFLFILFLHACFLFLSKKEVPSIKIKKIISKSYSHNRVLKMIVQSSDSKFKILKVREAFLGNETRTFEHESLRLYSPKKITFKDLQLTSRELRGIKKIIPQIEEKIELEEFVENRLEGDRTRLNTIAFKYFSFFQRIKSKLSPVWKSRVQNLTQRRISPISLKTIIRIWINKKGELVKLLLIGSSGASMIDQAALDSLTQVAPFENPPKGLFLGGVFSFDWGFIVLKNKSD